MRTMRRGEWEKTNGGSILEERTLTADQVLPEDLQNYEARMVNMVTDVLSLYPSQDSDQVGASVKEAILKSNIK